MTYRAFAFVLVASAAATTLGGCNFSATNDTVASKYVKTLPLAAGEGGQLEVTAGESPELAGTRLEIPPGSVAEGTTITLALQRQSIAAGPNTALGPVAVFGPAGLVFTRGARLTLPMRADSTASPQDLYVEVVEENGERHRIEALEVSLDSTRVSFAVAGFTRFQVAAAGCDAGNPCGAGKVCVAGRCRAACGGTACGADETCVNGRCERGCADPCDIPPTSCHEAAGHCDQRTLRCVHALKASGAACDDGNACTLQDACEAGVCSGTAVTCGANQHCGAGGICDCDAGHLDCDGAAANGCEHAGTSCQCTPESDASFCAHNQRECGSLAGIDNCGAPRTVDCGGCGPCSSCVGGACAPGCCSESDSSLCTRLQKVCGLVTAMDNCAVTRTVDCGACAQGEVCDATNACVCAPESDVSMCLRLGRECGPVSGTDNCGAVRNIASCGTCVPGDVCSATNVCVCAPESDVAMCQRLGRACGPVSDTDNCGAVRTLASCGTCATGEQCLGTGLCSAIPPANDTCFGASPLAFNASTGIAIATGSTLGAADDERNTCVSVSGRDVVYSFTIAQPSSVDVEVQPASGASWQPAVHLRSVCSDIATELGCGRAPQGGRATISAAQLAPGTYYVWVDGATATDAGAFSLTVQARHGGVPSNDACFAPRPLLFTAGVSQVSDYFAGAANDSAGSCGGSLGPDLVYSFTLVAPTTVEASITRAAGATNQPVIYLRADCFSASNEIACGGYANGTATLRSGVLPPGTYYLWADNLTTAVDAFDLQVRLIP